MADISANFRNDFGQIRRYGIVDRGRDPTNPPTIFDGFLDPGQATDLLNAEPRMVTALLLAKRCSQVRSARPW